MVEWRTVKDFPCYEVSNTGLVRRKTASRVRPAGYVLGPGFCGDGYQIVQLKHENKQRMVGVHLLVAETFIGERPEGYETHHKDFSTTNNHVDNLEFVSMKEHRARHADPNFVKKEKPWLKQHFNNNGTTLCSHKKNYRNGEPERTDLEIVDTVEEVTCKSCLILLGLRKRTGRNLPYKKKTGT